MCNAQRATIAKARSCAQKRAEQLELHTGSRKFRIQRADDVSSELLPHIRSNGVMLIISQMSINLTTIMNAFSTQSNNAFSVA